MKFVTFPAVAVLALLAACTPKASQPTGNAAAGKTVATVNGTAVSKHFITGAHSPTGLSVG